jgi:hypothetical protein
LHSFKLAPRLYEVIRLRANLLRYGEQIGLMRLEEPKQGREEHWIGRFGPKLLSPDSGQVDEPPRPTFVTKRCR